MVDRACKGVLRGGSTLGLFVKVRQRGSVELEASRLPGGGACLLIRKHDHFTPTREIKRHVRALARNRPEGWELQGHVSRTTAAQHATRRQPPPLNGFKAHRLLYPAPQWLSGS